MRKLLVFALVLVLTPGCKKALENLEKDTQIQPGENPKPMVHITGTVINPGEMLNNPNGNQPQQVPNGYVKNQQPNTVVKNNPQPMPMVVQKQPMGNGSTIVNQGSGGPVQAVRKAVTRTVTLNEMKNIHLFIENASGASGEMPAPQVVQQIIAKEDPKAASMIADGTIILTGIRQREGVWAYEKAGLENGGIVVTQSGVERVSAQQLKGMLQGQ